MSNAARAALAADRAQLRYALAERGFADDGEVLRGPVKWRSPGREMATAVVDIRMPERFPFGPPAVWLVDAGTALEIAFHQDPDGAMCLWDTSEPVSNAAWTDPDLLLGRITGWLENSAAGWPGDDDCDLERYVPGGSAAGIVLYDYDMIRPLRGYLRTAAEQAPNTTVLPQTWRPPVASRKKPRRSGRRGKPAPPTGPRHLAYAADLGSVTRPLRDWDDIAAALGTEAISLRRYINQRSVELLLLWYKRGQREGALALAVQPSRHGSPPVIQAREAADTSQAARTLRSGALASELAEPRVAIVGCGAIGSHTADLLYREGVRHLHLIDRQTLRPGNIIRHIATPDLVGTPKAQAVKTVLERLGLGTDDVQVSESLIMTPDQALNLLNSSDLVIDATADERATALLCWAAEATQRPMLTVCVQRQGGIARVDRFPVRQNEQHLPPVPQLPGPPQARERGCGDAVSLTPPSAVVAAAELAAEFARDELTLECALSASTLRVLQPQPDTPYDHLITMVAALRTGADTSS
jgi:molybdopterin/thiamine biosynthesis adenylyltransferase